VNDSPQVPQEAAGESLAETNVRLRGRVMQLELEIAKIRHDAYHDPLTGLPTRALMYDRINQAVLQATRQHQTVGLLLLDLDGFKIINDTMGHGAGDLLLQQLAGRLQACIRRSDTASRYGGDEFVVVLPEIDPARQEQQIRAVTRKIRAGLRAPYLLCGQRVQMRVSIGVAVLQDGQTRGDELIRIADAAMYRAKPRGMVRLALMRRRATPATVDPIPSSPLRSTRRTAPPAAAGPAP